VPYVLSIAPNLEKCILIQPITATPQLPEYKKVCGGVIKDPENYPSAIYHGERLYFCTRACLRVFEQNPDPFMAGKMEHPIEED
jgi:YHS domain-containing protein